MVAKLNCTTAELLFHLIHKSIGCTQYLLIFRTQEEDKLLLFLVRSWPFYFRFRFYHLQQNVNEWWTENASSINRNQEKHLPQICWLLWVTRHQTHVTLQPHGVNVLCRERPIQGVGPMSDLPILRCRHRPMSIPMPMFEMGHWRRSTSTVTHCSVSLHPDIKDAFLNYERRIAIACDEQDKTRPPCVPIIDVFTRRLISWKLEFCTPREAGVDRVRASWETAGRCAAVDRGNRRRDEIQGGLAFCSIHCTPSRRDSRVMAAIHTSFNSSGVSLCNLLSFWRTFSKNVVGSTSAFRSCTAAVTTVVRLILDLSRRLRASNT